MSDSLTSKYIEVQGVEQTFKTAKGPFVALRDINLSVAQGEFVVLLGESGDFGPVGFAGAVDDHRNDARGQRLLDQALAAFVILRAKALVDHQRFEARASAVGGQLGIMRLMLSEQFVLALPRRGAERCYRRPSGHRRPRRPPRPSASWRTARRAAPRARRTWTSAASPATMCSPTACSPWAISGSSPGRRAASPACS